MRKPGWSLAVRLTTTLLCAVIVYIVFSYAIFPRIRISSALRAHDLEWSEGARHTIATPDTFVPPDLEHRIYLPLVAGLPPARLLIAAAYIDSALSGEADEAIMLWNAGYRSQALAGWQLLANGGRATFPVTSTLRLAPGARLWCTAQSSAFRSSFGESPACAWESSDNPNVIMLDGSPRLTNRGGTIQLLNAEKQVVDTLLYADTQQVAGGWEGPPAQLYTRGVIAAEGQIWQRKLTADTDWPVDSDRAGDWAGDLADTAWGRRVRFPGWQGWYVDGLVRPKQGTDLATTTVAVAPEGLYAPLAALLSSATHSIDLSIYILEHPQLAEIVAGAARRKVRVRLLLEGGPSGGITDLQRWCVARLAAAGAEITYLASTADAPRGYHIRYRFAHAKYGIVDGHTAFVGTENFTWNAMPVDTQGLAGGRRGYYLITDAPGVVETLQQIFAFDWAPDLFWDLHPYIADHPLYGGPPADFALPVPPAYQVDSAPFAQPVTTSGSTRYVVVSAPENVLRPDDGLFALLQRAGPGDEILMEQLYEHKYWGDGQSNPIADPNPRLEMIVDAARRGAQVRVLLDSFFDDPEALRSNRATVNYLRALAQVEGLDIQARVGNPTGGGIHAKIVLVRVDGETWSAVGSLNGGEISHKINREVVLMVDHPLIYARLLEVFLHDWAVITR